MAAGVERCPNDRLDVEDESGLLGRAGVLLPVELKRHADERGNQIRELLGQLGVRLIGWSGLRSAGRCRQDDETDGQNRSGTQIVRTLSRLVNMARDPFSGAYAIRAGSVVTSRLTPSRAGTPAA